MLIIADSKTPFPQGVFDSFGELRQVPTKEIMRGAITNADVLVVRSETRVDRALLEGTRIRFVGTATIGTDHVDLEYLAGKGIGFASAPGSNANSVAEYIVAALLELCTAGTLPLKGSTIGIVGVGNVGTKVDRVARVLGMNTLLNDPPLARATGDPGYVPLDALMEADVVTIHVPFARGGSDPTHHLFGQERLERMRRGSILINTSRGGVVETAAAIEALRARHLGGAVLDVWEKEPSINPDLLSLATIGTPHIAGYSRDGKRRAAKMIYDSVCRFFSLEPCWADSPADAPTAAMRIHPDVTGSVEFLRAAVRECYDIRRDDADLKAIVSLSTDRRADYFRGLRSHYRVRKEFMNYIIELGENHAEEGAVLSSLGFKVERHTL